MRIFATSIVLACLTGAAQASSIVTLQSATEGPSVIVFAAPTTPARSSVIEFLATDGLGQRSSVVAFGEPTPSVDDEEVAAIPGTAKPRRIGQSPMVMRGGVPGEAFVRAEAAPQAPPTEEPAAAEPEPTSQSESGPTIRLAPPDEAPAAAAEPAQDGPVLR